MNDELVMDSADAFANRILAHSSDPTQRVVHGYALAYGREPSEDELNRALGFIHAIGAGGAEGAATESSHTERLAWSLFCQSLLASNEFIYIR